MRRTDNITAGTRRALIAATCAAALVAGPGCKRDGCVGGDDGKCLPPAACPALTAPATCPSTAFLNVASVTDVSARAPGPKALAANEDLLLENDSLRAVLDEPTPPGQPTHAQGLAPSGGTLIDLSPKDGMGHLVGDQLNGVFQGAGLLPRDAVHYERWEVIDQRLAQASTGAFVAVVFRGHLEGDPRVTVVTRYELRPCERGLRVRTDIYNGARDPNTLSLTDAFFWGDRTLLPFVPGAGLGFRAPSLDLLHLSDAWREWPFMAARSQAAPDVAYASVPCDRTTAAGFNDPTLSASGVPLAPTLPGDGLSFERFLIATPGPGLASAVGEAMSVRAAVHGDPPAVTVAGRVITDAGPLDPKDLGSAALVRSVSLLFYEPAAGPDPDDETRRVPRTEVVPGPDGRFEVTLPPDRVYRVQPYAFGLPAAAPSSFAVAKDRVDVGDLTLPRAGHLVATVEQLPGKNATFAELVLVPIDAPPASAMPPSLYGLFAGCNPMLGAPHGGSPACNRALTTDGRFDLLVPAGRYYVYATRGPFASLDRREIELGSGDQAALSLISETLPDLVPAGTLSGDFHVHGGASYDSSIPDQDRVVSFLAAGVDVIVATDHDVVTSYADTLAALGVTDQLVVVPGVEQTPNILWFDVPGQTFPKTVGHFNFWPLARDDGKPRNGSPWDELREPGQMMEDIEPDFVGAGVRQMNHPWSEAKLGRDQGFLRMIQMDPRRPLTDEGYFAGNVLLRTPGKRLRNIDFDVQEVMTGASRRDWLRYRTLWFSLLSQGFLRAGAANSDSHTLSIERVGYPRNLVFGGHDRATFDREKFDADVRAGHMFGTNGPVLDVTIDDATGALHRPDLRAAFVTGDKSTLTVTVAAAPWIPLAELRVFVNGALALTKDIAGLLPRTAHFGLEAQRLTVPIPLKDLALPSADAWLVVEVGMKQELPPDDDDDGLPDLADADLPTRPPNAAEPTTERFDLEAIAPGVWPVAFSNPFLLERNGTPGWQAPGLP
ncbi:MAG TPA: CehA/McbA family metallohydrolase [Polyangia bacterium]|nr:CehA/McbA family metallohydrolase [Polyangia bacterium]